MNRNVIHRRSRFVVVGATSDRHPPRGTNPLLGVEPLEGRRLLASIVVTSAHDDVTADGQVTLREAIQAAETDTSVDGSVAGLGADVITFAPNLIGSVITLSQFDTGLDNGEFGATAFILSTDITIQGPTGNDGVTIRRNPANINAFRLFHVKTGGSLTLENLTLSGGFAMAGSGGPGGGGAAGMGGAVFNQGTLTVTRSTLSGNTARGGVGTAGLDGGGGGVGANGGIADGGGPNGGAAGTNGGPGGFGGGGGSGIVAGAGGFGGGGASGYFGGQGGFGGGGGEGVIPGTGGFGGGDGGATGGGAGAGLGGAIFNESGNVTLTNSTLSGNQTQSGDSFGGNAGTASSPGLFSRNGSTVILNSTFANGGYVNIVADGGSNAASARIDNAIFADGAPEFTVINGGSLDVQGGNNLASTGSPGGIISVVANPQLGALSDNGGPTLTHLPAPTSPAVDNGSNAAASTLLTDQRGARRIAPAGGAVDLGSVEVGGDVTPGTLSIGDVTLLEGNAGQTFAAFTVTRSGNANGAASVEFSTGGGTATGGVDYALESGQLTFAPGQITRTIFVKVSGDLAVEPDETFLVTLFNAFNATLADGQATGTITNDDIPPPAPLATAVIGPDPAAPGKMALIITGTDNGEYIDVDPGSSSSKLKVEVDDVLIGEFNTSAFDRIYVYAKGGDDRVAITTSTTKTAVVFGGDGQDQIKGGNGKDILLGEGGADIIRGRKGRDIIIGGLGADGISGDEDDDLIIAAATTYDADLPGLFAFQKEWVSSNTYSKRRDNVRNGTGSNVGGRKLNDVSILEDNALDLLSGNSGTDLFFYHKTGSTTQVADKINDKSSSETAVDSN